MHLPEHISYSQVTMYEKCPRQWYLSKVAKAEEKQTWYLPVGTAVHSMVEDWLDPTIGPALVSSSSAETFFFPLIREQMKIQPDVSQWLSGGSLKDPTVKEKALQQVKDCFERALEVLEDIDVFEVEWGGEFAIEGLDIPVKLYIDILGQRKSTGKYIIPDWKTGKGKPSDPLQLETYAAALKCNPGLVDNALDYSEGYFIMLNPAARKDPWGKPIDLTQVNPGQIGARYQKVYDQIKKRDFRAKASSSCKACFFQESCTAYAGPTPQALYYDKAEKDGFPF